MQASGRDWLRVTVLPVDGRSLVDPDDVRRALRPNTKLISIMMANNETGVLQPVEEIGKIAAEAESIFTPTRCRLRQSCDRCEAHRLSRALDFRPQDSRAARRGRAVRAEGNSPAAAVLWWTPRTLAPRRNGKCPGNCRSGQGRAAGQSRTRSRRRQEDGRHARPLAAGNPRAGRRCRR